MPRRPRRHFSRAYPRFQSTAEVAGATDEARTHLEFRSPRRARRAFADENNSRARTRIRRLFSGRNRVLPAGTNLTLKFLKLARVHARARDKERERERSLLIESPRNSCRRGSLIRCSFSRRSTVTPEFHDEREHRDTFHRSIDSTLSTFPADAAGLSREVSPPAAWMPEG